MYEAHLTKAGFKVLTCDRGDDALALVEHHKPVILLADSQMPGITGPELCGRIRELACSNSVFAILVTGHSQPEEIAAGLDVGANDYLVKPVHPTVLLARVRAGERVLRLWSRQCEYTRKLESEIEKRRRTEEALRESEEKFRTISTSAQDAIIMMDGDGDISFWNEAAETIFGHTREEAVGRHLHSKGFIVPERFHEAHHRKWPEFQQTGQGSAVGRMIELVARRKDGTEFPVEVSLSAVKINGRWHAIGMLRDITERRNAETELRKLSVAIEQSPASIVITDTQGTIEYVNPRFTEITGYTAAEAIGQNPRILKSGKWPEEAYKALWDSILSGKTWTGELENKKKSDEVYWEAASISPIRDASGTITHFLAVKQDITERKKSEQALAKASMRLRDEQEELKKTHTQLLHAQKMESIGQLAAGIAHEINTPIQFVGDNTRFLQDSVKDLIQIVDRFARVLDPGQGSRSWDERTAEIEQALGELDVEFLKKETPKAIEQSLEGVDRVAKIVRSMKEFSHPGGSDKQPADLNKAIESTVTVSRNEWKYVAEMSLELDASLPPVPCLLGDFNQVVLNIIINAAHAITDVVGKDSGKKGTITISTRIDGDWAEVRISDTGGGIPEEIRRKVFDPFFTTKEVGKGTGQGLAIARNVVVQEHGGTIDVESHVGQGTTFTIRLPIEQEPKESVETQTHEAANSVC
jgi:two-component system, NtrC family, sensor kinase